MGADEKVEHVFNQNINWIAFSTQSHLSNPPKSPFKKGGLFK
jgi:hypothetical protein